MFMQLKLGRIMNISLLNTFHEQLENMFDYYFTDRKLSYNCCTNFFTNVVRSSAENEKRIYFTENRKSSETYRNT